MGPMIFEKFKEIFPQFVDKSRTWSNNGPHSINIHMIDHTTLIFSYYGERKWRLEDAMMVEIENRAKQYTR